MTIERKVTAVHGTGIQPWPVQHDHTKAPRGAGWRDLHNEMLSVEETLAMFEGDDTGMGVLCGAVSGNLELLEFEGRFVNSDGYNEFLSRCEDEGLGDVLRNLQRGYEVVSPTGGIHLLFRTEGPARGNTKLARRPALAEELEQNPADKIKTLIETRGEGGFAILAGSNGEIHPNGGKWALQQGHPSTIATITSDEREMLYELASTFDEMPAPPQRAEGLPGSRPGGGSDLIEWVVNEIGVAKLLIEDGWVIDFAKRNGEELWVRPGKHVRDGHSASLFPDGGMNVYSTSISASWERVLMQDKAFPYATPIGVLAAVRHDGDIAAAMSAVRKSMPKKAPEPLTFPSPQWDGMEATALILPGNVDPATGEILPSDSPQSDFSGSEGSSAPVGLNIPSEFWEARPILSHIRDAAWHRSCSPDAVLAEVLARYSATIPVGVQLPGDGTLDVFFVPHGASGKSKSKAGKTARRLYPGDEFRGVMMDQNVGSGEGLAEAFFEWQDEDGKPCGANKKGARKVRVKHSLHFATDEGAALQAATKMTTSILIPTLCAAWMGEAIGQLLADPTKSRMIAPMSVRVSACIRIQTAHGWKLFAEAFASTGLAQRMVCVSSSDPSIWERFQAGVPKPEWPGELDLPPFPYLIGRERILEYSPAIQRMLDEAEAGVHNPASMVNALDTHGTLSSLKMAAIFALWEERTTISDEDLALAQMIYAAHIRNRDVLQATHAIAAAQTRAAVVHEEVERTLAVSRATDTEMLAKTIKRARTLIASGDHPSKNRFTAGQREHYEEARSLLDDEGVWPEGV